MKSINLFSGKYEGEGANAGVRFYLIKREILVWGWTLQGHHYSKHRWRSFAWHVEKAVDFYQRDFLFEILKESLCQSYVRSLPYILNGKQFLKVFIFSKCIVAGFFIMLAKEKCVKSLEGSH